MTEKDGKKDSGKGGQSGIYDRIVKYTGLFGGVQAISLILAKIKSVLLGPVGYGISENLNRATDLVKSSTNLGITTVAVPEISQSSSSLDAEKIQDKVMLTRSWALLTAVAGMVVCLLCAPLLSRWAFDGDDKYTVGFIVLSLAVAAAAVTGGETAILRGSGMLRQIALSQLISVCLSLLISAPLYWFLDYDGIVPALALVSIASMIVTCAFSFRRFQYRVCLFKWSYLKQGTEMIRMGVYLTVTAFLGSWAWSFLAHYMTRQGGESLTGTYSAGYMLVTYMTTLLLSVTDSEYYPRLSAAGADMKRAHTIMNDQAMAMCMLSAPVVIVFILSAPAIVYVALQYEKFQMSIRLAQLAAIGLFFKSVSQPIAYLVLARSDSKVYLFQESFCYILLIICVMIGYRTAEMVGVGLSFAVWELLYLFLVLLVSRFRYGFGLSAHVVRNFLCQGVFVAIAAAGIFFDRAGFVAGVVMCVGSIAFSLHFFGKHTTFLPAFLSKILSKRVHC